MPDKPLRLEWIPAADLAGNPNNWRQHPELQRDALDALLFGEDAVGWAGAALYNERTQRLIDGHLRREVGIIHDEPIPVLIGSWTEEEEKRILATLDPIAAMAEANREKLGALLQSVQSDQAAVQEMLSELAEREGVVFGGNGKEPEPPEPQTDRAEELQAKWQVSSGDVWQAGSHFVICGDCREPETWERLLSAAGVEKVNGVFTSPPYAEQRKQQYGGVPVAEYVDWWEAIQTNVRGNLAGDGSFFVNIKPHCEDGQRVLYVFDLVLAMVRRWGWRFVDELCWKKNGVPGNFVERFRNDFEPIYHFCSMKDTLKIRVENVYTTGPREVEFIYDKLVNRQGTGVYTTRTMSLDGTRPSNVLQVAVDTSGQRHAAAFPVALPDFFIRAYSDPGDVWLDPFLGSGTTICAAHQNDRRGLGIEKLEKYVSVTLERLQGLGLDPQRID